MSVVSLQIRGIVVERIEAEKKSKGLRGTQVINEGQRTKEKQNNPLALPTRWQCVA